MVNISLGANGGLHDGSTLVEQALDYFVSQKANRAIVIAAGNFFGQDLHAEGKVLPGKSTLLTWLIPENDPTSNEMEVWYDSAEGLTAEIINPQGATIAQISPEQKWATSINDIEIMTVIHRVKDSANGKNHIQVFFRNGVPPGKWKLRLTNSSKKESGTHYHAWIERDDAGQSRFLATPKQSQELYKITNSHTLNSIANGKHTIVVGSFNAYEKKLVLGSDTAAGPTYDGREKPDIVAPGEKVFAAHSRTRVLRRRQSGTSMAAAAVTGITALLLAEAKQGGIALSHDEIGQILRESTGQKTWESRLGFGRVSAAKALALVRKKIKAPKGPRKPVPRK